MIIQFWGVRGSIPAPSSAEFVTSRYGGNTHCVSVRIPGQTVILDGGSGLRTLGLELARAMPCEASFFFSHLHWDHIQGFPFFVPGFVKGNTFTLYGPQLANAGGSSRSMLEYALRMQQADVNFPVKLSQMSATLKLDSIACGQTLEFKGSQSVLRVTAEALNHPGGCFGYRLEEVREDGSRSFVYATDTEHGDTLNPSLQKLARQADILLYDAQYTEEEYLGHGGISHKGWGHSTWLRGIMEASAAGVKHLYLTHHDPLHDDWAVARIESDARKEGLKTGLPVTAAKEGTRLVL